MRWFTALMLLGSGVHVLAQSQYEVVDLTKMFGEDFSARDINNNGVVLGSMRLNFSQSQACVVENGKLTMLPMYQGKHPWHAIAINDNGDVLGAGTLGTGTYRTVLYRNGVVIDTGLFGSNEFAAGRGLDPEGRVVGSIPDPNNPDAFIWENGTTTILQGFSQHSDGANAINDSGVVTGFSTIPGGSSFHAVKWDKGIIEDLHPAWSRDSMGLAINSKREVAGWGWATTGGQRAVLWRGGQAIQLGDFGGGQSSALDMNDLSQVVGWATDPGGISRGFLWQEGVIFRLEDLVIGGSGFQILGRADAINNDGQLVSIGFSGGVGHHLLLNPVPEIGTGFALACGLCVLAVFRRRSRRE